MNGPSSSRSRRSSDRITIGFPRRALLVAALALWPVAGLAQDNTQIVRSPILVIDFEELFRTSEYGQRIEAELNAESRALSDEIARIDSALAEEERELTEIRGQVTAEEFRRLADAFDAKVQRLRNEQDERAQAHSRLRADEQVRFRQAVLPVLGQLMLDAGALTVVEKRSVLLFNDAINITAVAASRLDSAVAAQTTKDDAPEPQDGGEGASDNPSQEVPDPEPDRPEPDAAPQDEGASQ